MNEKGYIRSDPDLSPIANSFWTGSYPSAVGECGKPWRKVCREKTGGEKKKHNSENKKKVI